MRRYALAVAAAAALFAIVNGAAYWRRVPPCCDMSFRTGIPFHFVQEGGFVGVRHVLWAGVAGDAACIGLIAFLVGRLAGSEAKRRHRIGSRGPSGGEIAGREGQPEKKRGDGDEGCGVGGADVE